jgi:hypothetical protein
MGSTLSLTSHTYSIYGRFKTNSAYTTIDPKVDDHHMARFKHETYAHVLERAHLDLKALYLYQGSTRRAKAELVGKYLEITFDSTESKQQWDDVSEQIENVQLEIPWLAKPFHAKWKEVQTDEKKNVYIKRQAS